MRTTLVALAIGLFFAALVSACGDRSFFTIEDTIRIGADGCFAGGDGSSHYHINMDQVKIGPGRWKCTIIMLGEDGK